MSRGYSTTSNPYTPRSEIQEPDSLAGRDETLDGIVYKLSQAASDEPKFPNIAVSGKPGMGKSSVCNCIPTISEELDLTPIQFNLEKEDANNPSKLIKRIHRKLLLENRIGRMKLRGRKLTRPLKEVMVNIPGVPVQFSLGSNPGFEHRSRQKFSKTLGRTENPVVLVLDNAHTLLDQPSTLTKLHNVFSDLDGLVLVLAGDEELYGETTREYGHVWRKFEFYTTGTFSSVSQTQEALRTPIRSEEDVEIPEETVHEVHEMTEGQPGEINLLGYYMYKQAGEKDSQTLQLTPAVLSQTLAQLEHRKPSLDTSKVARIDALSEGELRVLVATLEAPPMSKEGLVNYCVLRYFDKIRPTEYESQKEEKARLVEALLETDLLAKDDHSKIRFTGGSYDQLYAKLSLYTQDEFELPTDRAILTEDDIIAHIHYELIDKAVLGDIPDCHSLFKKDSSPTSLLYSLTVEETPDVEDLYAEVPRLSIETEGFEFSYDKRWTSIIDGEVDGYTRSQTCIFGVNLDWLDERYIVIIHADIEAVIDKVRKQLEYVESRVREIGISIQWDTEFSHYYQGLDDAKKGKCRKAIEEFQAAVEINPEFAPAWFLEGIVHKEHSDYEEAKTPLEEAVTHRSDWVDALIALSRVLWQLEETDEFIRTVESVSELLPDDSQFLHESALRLELDDPHKAVEFADRAYGTDNSFAESLVCAMGCSYEDDRYENAIEYYEKIANHDEDLPDRQQRIVDLYYAGTLIAQERFDEAFEEIASFSDGLGVDFCALNYAAGVCLMEQEQWSEALDYFISARNSKDDRMTESQVQMSYTMCSQARENRTWVDIVLDEREKRAYSSILPAIDDRSPLDRDIYKKEAEALLHVGKYERAIENFGAGLSYLASHQSDNELILGKVQALAANYDWEEAYELLDEHWEVLKVSVRALYLKSSVSHAVDDKSSSTLGLREAIDRDSEQVKDMIRSDIYPDLWIGDKEKQIRYVEMKTGEYEPVEPTQND